MRLTIAIVLALILAAPAWASCSLQSVRLPAGLIMVGDSERAVIEAGPDRTVQLQTRQGGAAGYRHDFYRRGETVQIYIQAGRVVRVCRVRD
ncbi:MAG: DUF2845 domain-containing protein [Wenzhouxiangella sp.]|nr:MAG: DUF2845 domain-containing protein [Wenzhouxiangella sp.]